MISGQKFKGWERRNGKGVSEVGSRVLVDASNKERGRKRSLVPILVDGIILL